MNPNLNPLKQPPARGAILLASFIASAACLCAVVLVFDRASNDPFLRDSAQARLAVARCDGLDDRGARDRCVRALIVKASGRDGDGSRPTAIAVVERGGAGAALLRPVYRL